MNDTQPIDAVLFDMDGLLFDTENLYFEAMQTAGREAGYPVSRALYQSLIGHTWEATHRLLGEHFGPAFAPDAFHAECHRQMDRLLVNHLRLKPGVGELLDLLDTLRLPRALVTSSRRASVDHHLGAFDMTERFDAIVAHGDYRQGKPAPDPYLRAAERLGVEPARCLALEDSHNGVRSAAAAGAVTIMVPDMLEATDEMRALCAAIVPDLGAISAALSSCKREPCS